MMRAALRTAIGLGLALAALPAMAQTATWNQQEVTALAVQLAEEAKNVRRAVRSEPSIVEGSQMNRKVTTQYLDTLQKLERATGQLARKLTAGEGHDETLGSARRIGMLLRDTRTLARRLDVPAPTAKYIEPAEQTIEKIQPFYASVEPGVEILAPEGGASE